MPTLLPLLLASAAVAAAPDAVILDFTAKWCGPCQQINPLVSKYIRDGYAIEKIDVDKHQDLVAKYQVKSIPCFILLVNGREAGRVSGAGTDSLNQLVARLPKPGVRTTPAKSPATAPSRPETIDAPRTFAQDEMIADRSRTGEAPQFAPPVERAAPKKNPAPSRAARNEVAENFTRPVIRAKVDQNAALESLESPVDPAAASVRIRVRDRRGINFGSGTVVDSRPGRSIVLTCGHVVRDLQEDSIIEVDVFRGGRPEMFVGKVVRHDMEADAGLLEIPTDSPLAVARVAAAGSGARVRDRIFSIGCGGGEPPSRMDGEVTALDKYLGPSTIECTGVPRQGRSGGGLFNGDGVLVGICSAANTTDQRGLYCGLKPIHGLLDAAQLARVYGGGEPAGGEVKLAAERETGAVDELAPTTARAEAAPADSDPRQSEEVRRALADADGAEIICIIRRPGETEAASRVVVINRASPKFLAYLNGEFGGQPADSGRQVAGRPVPPDMAANDAMQANTQPYRRTADANR